MADKTITVEQIGSPIRRPAIQRQTLIGLGLNKIRAHATQLTDRLQQELPPLGYQPLTPRNNPTPILAFAVKDAAATNKALHDAKITATVVANESRLRLSVSVFNTHEDIDRVVDALGGRARTSIARG